MRGASLTAAATLVAAVLVAAPACGATAASARPRSPRAADSSRGHVPPGAGLPRAPSYPPLIRTAPSTEGAPETGASSSPQAEADPLVSNGLGSPFCRGVFGEGALSASRALDCQTSGFSAAGAPTGNWGIDVHIDTGLLGISSGGLLGVVQNLFVAPLWMGVVWSVHALVVMLEWCFAIDLLDSPASGAVGAGLRQMQAAVTDPWLAAVLAVAAVLALYNGLIRRRVADTVGQAAVMGAMMAAALWLIADPQGTVGAIGRLANQASLGTLAVSARGTTGRPGAALADSMAVLFASAIEAPWCYLEFGDVGWCRNPARLDPRLRAAAGRIADGELAVIGCRTTAAPLPCVARGSAEAKRLEGSAALLRAARTNGSIFLALPAGGGARNSISEEGSLLRSICEGGEATRCRGPTAAQAQFRTNSGTWSRVGGLLLILGGILGMLLLFGFIALRLLGAALFSLLYLLLAPMAVLAPALGEAGRAVFRRWATHLFAAVVAKLLFSFVLGVVLAVLAILASLEGLGWWTQWLLMSAFWWGAYARRHQALAFAQGAIGHEPRHGQQMLVRRMIGRLDAPQRVREAAKRAKNRMSPNRTEVEQRDARRPPDGRPPGPPVEEQARRLLERTRREGTPPRPASGDGRARPSAERTRLTRLQREHAKALAAGDTRRAAKLAHRKRRVEEQLQHWQREADTAAPTPDGGGSPQPRGSAKRGGPEIDPRRVSRTQPSSMADAPAPAAGFAPPRGRPRATTPNDRDRLQPGPLRDRERGAGDSDAAGEESSVMRDAREVAARRKRQLGTGRP